MKKFFLKRGLFLLVAFLALLSNNVSAQDDLNPIKWSIKKTPATVKAGESFNLEIAAEIDKGWHLYSLEQPAGGPIPTRIKLPENQKFKLSGEIESPPPQVVFDTNFNMDTQFYENEAVFTLPVEASRDTLIGKNTLSVNTFYQTCNDSVCLPPKTVKLTAEIDVIDKTAVQVNLGSAATILFAKIKFISIVESDFAKQ